MKPIASIVLAALCVAGCAKLPSTPVDAPLRPGKVVVFDIDGTLTPENIDVLEVRKDAVNVVKAYSDKGYRILYLTARSLHLQQPIPYWLNRYGFPKGDLQTAQTSQDRKDPATFKANMLENYKKVGWKIAFAYGDSTTDFQAYERAGIAKEHVFALLRENDKQCQPGVYSICLKGYTEHLPFVETVASVKSSH